MKSVIQILLYLLMTTFFSCSSGGGDGGSGSSSTSGKVWNATAFVTQDSCGERTADVRQQFAIENINGSLVTDTGITKVISQSSGGTTTFEYSETNGDCTRTYSGEINETSSSEADINLVSKTDCGTVVCQTTWSGTASNS